MKRELFLAFVLLLPLQASAQKRGITDKDLFDFVWVADPEMAPDGSQVAFVRVTVDEKKEGYASSIWIAKRDGSEAPRPLTNGPRDTTPRWSPDGRQLAFVRSTEKDGKPEPPQIYVMPAGPGEPKAITDLPRGAGAPEWAPDGKTIAFSSGTKPAEIGVKKDPNVHESDVRVITEAVYRANGIAGSGFVDRDHPSHIWTIAVPSGSAAPAKAKQITSGEFSEGTYHWSRDGSQLYFISNRQKEAYYYPQDSDLYRVPKDGGELTRVASIAGGIGDYTISPDGRRIAFVGTLHGEPVRSYSQSDLFVVDPTGGMPRNLTASYDFDIDGSVGGDQRAPRGQQPAGPIWSRDGRSIVIRVGERGDANLVRIAVPESGSADGRVEPLTTGSQEIMSYTADTGAGVFAVVRSTPTTVGDLEIVDSTRSVSPLTSFNRALFSQLSVTAPEEFWYTSFDGKKIQGWIQKPIVLTGVSGLNHQTFSNGVTVPDPFTGTCTTCHDTPNAGDHSVKAPLNIGLTDPAIATYLPVYTLRNIATGDTIETTDPGRAMISGKWADVGRFKGPVLRALAARPPYFHNGSAATLDEVLTFYENRFHIGLTPQERADLLAFLKAL